MRMLGKTKDSINIVYDQVGTPTCAGDMVKAYNALDKDKIKRDFQISIPHWKESLQKCLNRF